MDNFEENVAESIRLLTTALLGKEVSTEEIESQNLYALFESHPTLRFIEEELSGKRVSITELRDRYAKKFRQGFDELLVQAELEAAFMLGSVAKSSDISGRLVPRFIPKLHAFFTQGKELRQCLNPDCAYLDDKGAITCPNCSEGDNIVRLFPIHFCRVCGQDYYGFGQEPDGTVVPFSILDEDVPEKPGYFLPREHVLTKAYYPEKWLTPKGNMKKDYKRHEPVRGYLNLEKERFGEDETGVEGHWLPVPFIWCPNCDMTYDRVPKEFSKLFLLNTIGRATGANVLIQGTMMETPKAERKIIAFTDNRQDTAFQSGHLNDWFQRIFFRRLLVTTLKERGHVEGQGDPLELTSAGIALFNQMEKTGTLPRFGQADELDDYGISPYVVKEYLTYCVIREMESSPRFTTLNSESVGLLQLIYNGLGKLAQDKNRWEDHPILKEAESLVLKEYLQGLLDIMRKQLAINHKGLIQYDDFRIECLNKVPEEFYFFPEPTRIRGRRPVVFTDDQFLKTRRLIDARALYSSHRFLNWTKRVWEVDRSEAVVILEKVFQNLTQPETNPFVSEFVFQGHKGKVVSFGRLWLQLAGDPPKQICPKCNDTYRWKSLNYCVNPRCGELRPYEVRTNYYGDYYQPAIEELFSIRATSHSGMVSGEQRREREIDFGKVDGINNVMIATPTMELGIDIGDLSAIYLRNVPPNPANYAQRGGRAGRSGQGALVVSFCGSGPGRGSHDQYFYRFPGKIVSGTISVPRFNLDNETMTKAHIHSLVLQTIDMKLENRAEYILEISDDGHKNEPLYPMKKDYKERLFSQVKDKKSDIRDTIFEALRDENTNREWFTEEFVLTTIDAFPETLDAAFDAWRLDYRDTAVELEERQTEQAQSPTEQLKHQVHNLATRLKNMRKGEDRFNVYNYLRHVGFLPNYAFPRSDVVLKFTNLLKIFTGTALLDFPSLPPKTQSITRGVSIW